MHHTHVRTHHTEIKALPLVMALMGAIVGTAITVGALTPISLVALSVCLAAIVGYLAHSCNRGR